MTCCTAAKPSCSPSHVEETSQNEKPSNHVKNAPSDDSTLMVRSSPQMKSLNIIIESTSSFADIQKTQQTCQLTQTTDNSCKFEFYDFASSQESGTGEDLCGQKDTSQPSLLQSKADFSDCEISYSPLSTFEESEEEAEEEEKKVKISQNKLFKVQNSEDEESSSVAFKSSDGLFLQQTPQHEHTKIGNFIIKKKHCEEVNTGNHLDHSVKTIPQSHMNSKFCNSACGDNQHQQEVLASGSSFPFNCEEAEQPELISSAAKAGNTKSVALSLASMNAKPSSAKELKQMDIGVFFGLKPKVKEESKGETHLSEGKQIPSSVTPNGKRPRQQKRKAEGSVEDVEAVVESSSANGAFADVSSGGQRRWRKKFKELPTTGEGTRKKHCPFYKKIPGER